ncbi:MAG: response regulator, partial [Pirellulaceae bacterium]
MSWFPHRSLRLKLVLLAAISAGVAVFLACISFISNDLALMRHAKRRQLEAQADMLGLASSTKLARDDDAAARQLFSKLADHPSIDAAALYDATGAKVAEYLHPGEPSFGPRPPEILGNRYSAAGQLEQIAVIDGPEGPLGVLALRADMSDINNQLNNYRYIVIWVIGCSMLMATALASILQGRISRPILELAKAADRINERDDYSLRVVPPSEDVTGHLYVAFNQMLDRIEASDRALKVAHDELEQRVDDRTAELSQQIAERQRVQDDLVRAKNAAESASRAKSEFLANMSHEIRTPLNAILGFADLLRRGMETSETERREYLETIHKSGGHLLSVINDILDLSKIEAGQLQVEQLRCCPAQIIAEAVSVLRVRAREKNLSLDYHWSGPLPESIVTDPARLRQLLLNVIGNAIKFTEEGGIQVVAQIICGDVPKLVVDVIDTGIGIPQDKLHQIFEPFCQADTSVTRRFGGTGLGLTICRRLARALGGGISVQSGVGKGSIFTIAIDSGPIDRFRGEGGPEAEFIHSENVASQTSSVSLAGRRILVADDGDSNRRLIQIVLGRAGAEIVMAANGRQAIEVAARQHLDLILMDMQMPVMDGYGAASAIRARGLKTPIIALTAHAMKGDREKCLAAGCTGYLTKPIDLDRLASSVAGWLSGEEMPAADRPRGDEPAPDAPLASTLPTDDPEFREIVAEFAGRFHEKLAAMSAALAGGNYADLKSLAHWLKGAGGTAGFAPLSAAAGRMEQAIS